VCRNGVLYSAFFVALLGAPAFASIENAPAIAIKMPAASSTEQLIRVRTHQRQISVAVAGFGLKINGQRLFNSVLPKKTNLKISFRKGQWVIGAPVNKTLPDESLVIDGDFMRANNTPVADRLVLIQSSKTKFDVISELSLDDYLKGVLPSEMPMRWPLESLKAQVVASRSYALSQIRVHEGENFHLDDSVMHQVFSWANYLNASQADQVKIIQALDETRGEVLQEADGSAYMAYFHSDCGGHTEEPNAVWGNGKKNGTVRDEHCALNTKSAWQEEIGRDEFGKNLATYLHVAEAKPLESIENGTLSPSGRVQTLLIAFEGESQKHVISGQALRQIFGFSRIKSTNFQFQLHPTSISFSGRGSGHGVGLCQQGSKYMAMAGADHREILHRYYPKAKL
jgi:stage II sporulation protein D